MERRKQISNGHMITENITEMEQEVLDAIAANEYMDGSITGSAYDSAIGVSFERSSFSGVVSSLVKKGLVYVDECDGEKFIGFTPKGMLFANVNHEWIRDYFETVKQVEAWFLAHDCTMPVTFGAMW